MKHRNRKLLKLLQEKLFLNIEKPKEGLGHLKKNWFTRQMSSHKKHMRQCKR